MAFTALAQGHLDVQTTVQKQETFVNEAGESSIISTPIAA